MSDRWTPYADLQDRIIAAREAVLRIDDVLFAVARFFPDGETIPERRLKELAAEVEGIANHLRAAAEQARQQAEDKADAERSIAHIIAHAHDDEKAAAA